MADPSWLRLEPFCKHLCGYSHKSAIIDAPHAPPVPPAGFRGVYLNGWQCHDHAEPAAAPQELWRELEVRFGGPKLTAERYGPQSETSLLELRAEAIAAAGQIGEIAAWVLGRERCDLAMIVLGAGHRAGHYLWDTSQIDEFALALRRRELLAGALREVYAACDRAVGRIASAAPSGSRIAVFALHGMGPNSGWTERFSEILGLLHGNRAKSTANARLRGQIRRACPIAGRDARHERPARHGAPAAR